MGLDSPDTPQERDMGQTKWPSTYTHHILTSEGSASSTTNDQMLPIRVPGASIMEEPDGGTDASQHAMSMSIPQAPSPGTRLTEEPDWPHWQDAMVKKVSELTTKCTWKWSTHHWVPT